MKKLLHITRLISYALTFILIISSIPIKLVFPPPVFAQCWAEYVPEVSYAFIDETYGNNYKEAYSEEPVNLSHGSYLYQNQDFLIPGRGFPLFITRTYNSNDDYSGPFGNGWTFNYNIKIFRIVEGTQMKLVVMNEDGSREIFFYNSYDKTFSPSFGVYDSAVAGYSTLITVQRKNGTRYLFNLNGSLTGMIDSNGNSITCDYNSSGDLIKTTDASGRSIMFNHDGKDRISEITDWSGRTWEYQYDNNGNLIKYIDAMGNMIQYQYDNNNYLISIIDSMGNIIITNAYNEEGRVISQEAADGSITHFSYDPANRRTTETNSLGHKTVYEYDKHYYQTKRVDAMGNTIKYTYDKNGNRDSITDANGNKYQYKYDKNGNITQSIDPIGNMTEMIYDSKNNLIGLIDSQEHKYVFEYDSNSNMLKSISPGELINVYEYDESGLVKSITWPSGKIIGFDYNKFGYCTNIADALGNTNLFEYDTVGNLLKLTDSNGNSTSCSYDLQNNLVKVTDALDNSVNYSYNSNRNMLSLTDANGNITYYAYDSSGRLASVKDALGNISKYSYDSMGNIVKVIDANKQETSYFYDALNRIAKVGYADGNFVSYSYDPIGNIISIEDKHGVSEYQYNELNLLTRVINTAGNRISYTYDSVGNRTSIIYPNGKAVSYTYDVDNRLIAVSDWDDNITNYSYDNDGNLLKALYPNKTSTEYSYDKNGRLIKLLNNQNTDIISSFEYVLDAVGNRIRVIEKFNPQSSTQAIASDEIDQEMQTAVDAIIKDWKNSGLIAIDYQYDKLYRLIKVKYTSDVSIDYTYDPMGNRTSLTVQVDKEKNIINYYYDAGDRLTKAGNIVFRYDGNGNLVEKKNGEKVIGQYKYDSVNRLIDVNMQKQVKKQQSFSDWFLSLFGQKPADSYIGITVRYDYDSSGNRVNSYITIDDKAESTEYTWDTANTIPQVLTEVNEYNTYAYIRGMGFISSIDSNDIQSYFYCDGLGSVRNQADIEGNLISTYLFDPFGQLYLANTVTNDYLFTGEQMDDTGLIYLRSRYYDPRIGRFSTRDNYSGWQANFSNLNRYVYALNNPLRYIDPYGTCPETNSFSRFIEAIRPFSLQSPALRALPIKTAFSSMLGAVGALSIGAIVGAPVTVIAAAVVLGTVTATSSLVAGYDLATGQWTSVVSTVGTFLDSVNFP